MTLIMRYFCAASQFRRKPQKPLIVNGRRTL